MELDDPVPMTTAEDGTFEVQEGGNDVVPWAVGVGLPLLLVAIVIAVIASLRR